MRINMTYPVLDVARKELLFSYEDDPICTLADAMAKRNIDSVIVIDRNQNTVGIVTVGDILRRAAKKEDLNSLKARDIMSSPLIRVSKDIVFQEALDIFAEKKITRLPLSNEGGKIIGMAKIDEVERFKRFLDAKRELAQK